MKVADIDYYALNGESTLHKSACGLKIIWVIMLITLVICLNEPQSLAIIYTPILLYVLFSKLPTKLILLLSIYPLIFVILFILASSELSLSFILMLILKVLIASTSMILLVITTPYIKLFNVLGKYLPPFLVTALFLTYRALFILDKTLGDIQQSIYLRGGISIKKPLRSLEVISNALGLLVIRSIESSENMYEGMRLRGHTTKLNYLDDKTWIK